MKSLVVIGSVSPRWSSQGTRRASLYFACLSIAISHVSFMNTFKHVILWFLYCLRFLSIERIMPIRNLSIYLSIFKKNIRLIEAIYSTCIVVFHFNALT